MSGGSMDYLFGRVGDARFSTHTPLRRALKTHMNLLSDCLRAVEWNDSGDGDDREEELLRKLLGPTAVLEQATADAKVALAELRAEIERVEMKE